MKLPGLLHKELVVALIDAFPNGAALARMVRYGLDERLTQIVGGTTLNEMVFDLVNWAEARDIVPKLIQAAQAENPNNLRLASIARQLNLA